jgi:hypothetical protein
MEAIVSSNHRQQMKGAAPAGDGALLDHAFISDSAGAAAFLGDRSSRAV